MIGPGRKPPDWEPVLRPLRTSIYEIFKNNQVHCVQGQDEAEAKETINKVYPVAMDLMKKELCGMFRQGSKNERETA